MVSDAVAEKLENAGLWRRAAARWLAVMNHCQTDAEREWVSKKRRECYAKIERPVAEWLNISAVSQAGNRAQGKTGIRQPGEAAFLIKPQKQRAK